MSKIDTENTFMVGGSGEKVVIGRLPRMSGMTRDEAAVLAAYLIAAIPMSLEEFRPYYEAVIHT